MTTTAADMGHESQALLDDPLLPVRDALLAAAVRDAEASQVAMAVASEPDPGPFREAVRSVTEKYATGERAEMVERIKAVK